MSENKSDSAISARYTSEQLEQRKSFPERAAIARDFSNSIVFHAGIDDWREVEVLLYAPGLSAKSLWKFLPEDQAPYGEPHHDHPTD